MKSVNTSLKKRKALMRKLLTEEFIEEVIVKFIVNIGNEQHREQRLVYHLKQGYFYFLNVNHLDTPSNNEELADEEIEFMTKINEYLPDEIRVQSQWIAYLRHELADVPVCGAIITRNKDKEILLVQDRRTGKYGLCKGKYAEQETAEECAIRQVRQQTGFRVNRIGKAYNLNVGKRQFTFMQAEVMEENPQLVKKTCEGEDYHMEIKEYAWWGIQQIKKIIQSSRCSSVFNLPSRLVLKQYLKIR